MPSKSIRTEARWGGLALTAMVVLMAQPMVACRADLPRPVDVATTPKTDAASDARDARAAGDTASDMRTGTSDAAAAEAGTEVASDAPPDAPLTSPDVAVAVDTAAPPDTAPPPMDTPAPAPDMSVTPGACGTATPDVSPLTGVEALSIGRDGTMYFAQSGANAGYVGRLRPGVAPEPRWLAIPNGATIWGLVTDDSRQRLYVASASGHLVHSVNLGGANPTLQVLSREVHEPDDLVIGPGGQLYFADSDNHIYRLTPGGELFRVTTSSFGGNQASALAFAPGGDLLVGTVNNGPVLRLEVTPGTERARSTFGAFRGHARALAVDAQGNVYVVNQIPGSESQVMRIAGDGSGPALVTTGPALTSLAFGRGALGCNQLYVGSRSGPMLRVNTAVGGFPVP